MNIKKKLYYCLMYRNIDGAKIFLALSSFIMSMMILLPIDKFTGLPYTIFDYDFPEWFWGVVFLLYSLLGIFNIVKKNNIKKLETTESYLGFFLWSILTLSIFYSSVFYPAILAPLITGTFLSWWVLIRTCLNNDRF